MRSKTKKIFTILLTIAVIVVCGGILLYSVVHEDNRILSQKDLDHCEMYIHNATCNEVSEARTVVDREFYDEIVSLCVNAEKFRPFVMMYDLILGGHATWIEFVDRSHCYTISLCDAEQQLALDYIHRDHPLIYVEMSEKNDQGHADTVWAWYCELPPQDYAQLCNLAEMYTGGEAVTKYGTALWTEEF